MAGKPRAALYRNPTPNIMASTPTPIVDANDRIIAVLAGRPKGPEWDRAAEGAADAIREAGKATSFTDEQISHRRGAFPAVGAGISFGNGQTVS